MNDIVRMQWHNNVWFVHLVTTEDDSECLMNLRNLIRNTKNKVIEKFIWVSLLYFSNRKVSNEPQNFTQVILFVVYRSF